MSDGQHGPPRRPVGRLDSEQIATPSGTYRTRRTIGAFRNEETREHNRFVRENTTRLLNIFYYCNGIVLAFVVVVWVQEAFFPSPAMQQGASARIITEHVVMSLIGATAVQLGALALGVGAQVLRITR